MAEKERETPKDIKFKTLVVDLACHPSKDYIAIGTIDGPIHMYSYSAAEENHSLLTLNHHKKSCRALRFSENGGNLYTASKDKSLQVVDMEKGAVKQAITKAHKSPIYCMLNIDDNIVATGDDDGVLKVWDLRSQKAVMESAENTEFISDMGIEKNKRILIATSGEGTVSAFDIRKHKMRVQSELFDSEFLSLAIMKNEQKVVCGNGDGTLNIFNWSEWGNISDRFPGHPMSVDCIAKFDEDIIFTGSIDGMIRAVNILPNRFLGVVGMHEEFPVENLSISRDKTLLASCSHDSCVKFWDISDVTNEDLDTSKKAKRVKKNKVIKKSGQGNDFFADLAEPEPDTKDGSDDDEDDSDDDSDDSDDDPPKKKLKTSDTNKSNTSSAVEDRLKAKGADNDDEESSDGDGDDDDEDEDDDDEASNSESIDEDDDDDEQNDSIGSDDSSAESDTGQE